MEQFMKNKRSLFDFFAYKKRKDIIQIPEQLKEVFNRISKVKEFSLDTETTHLKRHLLEWVVLSMAWKEGKKTIGVALPFRFNVDEDQHPLLKISEVHPYLKKALKSHTVIFHNAQYDMHVLEKYNLPINIKFEDTMLMSFVLDAESPHGLKPLTTIHLKRKVTKLDDVTGKRDIRDTPYPDVCQYAIDDAVNTYDLWVGFEKQLRKEPSLVNVYEKIDKPAVYSLIEMERQGISIDRKKLNNVKKKVEEDLKKTEHNCRRLLKVNRHFNLRSTQQLGEHLYGVLGLKCPAFTGMGKPKTDMKTIKKLVKKSKGVAELIRYKGLQKLYNDFILGTYTQLELTKDGKIYGGYNGTGTRTGRISSSQPNLQNIPANDKYGFRSIFIPDPGYSMIVEDYEQLELRIAAVFSKDPIMLKAFNDKEDIHQTVADMCESSRTEAKKVSFGVLYGMGGEALVEQIFQATGKWISLDTAYEYIERFKKRFRYVFIFMQNSIVFARNHGYCKTLFGRRRPLRNILSVDGFLRSADERKAYNTPVQGTGGDMTKLAQSSFAKERDKQKLDAQMLMQVHDEIVIQAKKSQAKKARDLLRKCMMNVIKSKMPVVFEVDASICKNWYQGKG
jgi:DNA polymerase-1